MLSFSTQQRWAPPRIHIWELAVLQWSWVGGVSSGCWRHFHRYTHSQGWMHRVRCSSAGFWRASTWSPMVAGLTYAPISSIWRFLLLHPHRQSLLSFFTTAILTTVRCNLTVVLICISSKNTEHFSYLYWPFVFHILRSVYPGHSLILTGLLFLVDIF